MVVVIDSCVEVIGRLRPYIQYTTRIRTGNSYVTLSRRMCQFLLDRCVCVWIWCVHGRDPTHLKQAMTLTESNIDKGALAYAAIRAIEDLLADFNHQLDDDSDDSLHDVIWDQLGRITVKPS